MEKEMITPQQAAEKLGVTVYRVHQMIRAERLPATAYGRFYLINESDLALVSDRKAGRPKKVIEPVAQPLKPKAKAEREFLQTKSCVIDLSKKTGRAKKIVEPVVSAVKIAPSKKKAVKK